ncbi:SRPBCC family protein [Streptomyces sp. NPDC059701]|uniref:SRPBCC family protein n=1 Tax=Streptomyces sp. NPDC059701 TaxID=3346914 RepID=UPI00368BACCD
MGAAELPRVRCDVRVRAAVPRVWDLVTDIHLPARLSPELWRVAWLDGALAPAVGARFEGHNRHPLLGEWRTVSHVVRLDEHRVFAWAVLDEDGRFGEPVRDPGKALASWAYELDADGDGTRLRQTAVLGPGRNGVTLAIEHRPERKEEILARRLDELRTGIESTLRGIRELAERSA